MDVRVAEPGRQCGAGQVQAFGVGKVGGKGCGAADGGDPVAFDEYGVSALRTDRARRMYPMCCDEQATTLGHTP